MIAESSLAIDGANPAVAPTKATAATRLLSIDLLRGLVMVLMALDHTRDFFSNAFINLLDLTRTTSALFLTRWITHLCAPVFVFLAGMAAYLYGTRGRSKAEVARFLLIRGLFLIILEFTLVHFSWNFTFAFDLLFAQVIWAIGWSMVAMAALVFLPRWAIVAVALVMIAGHNLLDHLSATELGLLDWLWIILHQGGTLQLTSDYQLFVLYPLIPWIGVMAAGYLCGPLLLRPPAERRRWLVALGLGLIVLFILLRWTNLYGDPQSWEPQSNALMTLLSFINTTKYPASLLFLAMTLGPTLLLLAAFDHLQEPGVLTGPLLLLGRVPLLYYLAHLMVIHAAAVVFSYMRYGEAPWLFGSGWADISQVPDGYGYELSMVYLVWLGVVIGVYPLCLWFAGLKRRHRWWWLSYL